MIGNKCNVRQMAIVKEILKIMDMKKNCYIEYINFNKQVKYFYASQTNSSKQSSNYTQRAYTPSYMSKMLLQQLTKTNSQSSPKRSQNPQKQTLPTPSQQKQQILHQFSLYYNKVLPFDYDYFTQSLKRLIEYQTTLRLEDILMIFDLSLQYKLDNLLIKTHFQNQLYCRTYKIMKTELIEYDIKLQQEQNEMYKALEEKSKDHFDLISEEYKKLMEGKEGQGQNGQTNQAEQQQNLQSKQPASQSPTSTSTLFLTDIEIQKQNKPVFNSAQRKSKSKNKLTQQSLTKITSVFLQSGSKKIQFNKMLLQIFTIRLDENQNNKRIIDNVEQSQKELQGKKNKKQQKILDSELTINPQFLLLYTKLSINLLQLYMSEYHTQQTQKGNQKYTHRSIKNIYKLQTFYYYEIAKLIQQKHLLENCTKEQLMGFVGLISSFPIRRRSFRKSFGSVLIEEFRKREMLPEKELMGFFQLSKYDNKILETYEQELNKGKALPQPQKQYPLNSQQKPNQSAQTPISQKQPLMASQIIQSQQNHQSNTNSSNQQQFFHFPKQMFRKVTKKKSKPKNKNHHKQSPQIDLTQQQTYQSGEKSGQQNISQNKTNINNKTSDNTKDRKPVEQKVY